MNKENKSEVKKGSSKSGNQLVVIRIRGNIHLRKEFKDTLNMLGLYKKNYCVVVPTNPSSASLPIAK